jgi:hypothetical protein
MKHILLFLPFFLFSLAAQAQVPDSFLYQLVVRDEAGKAVKNDTVSIEVSIVSDSAMGQSQYSEVHSAITTVSGLVTVVIGTGIFPTGNLAAINWESGPYYLKIRTDIEGGTNYGTAVSVEMVSVPYALYSGYSDTVHDAGYADTLAVSVSEEGDTLFLGTAGNFVVIPGLSEANHSSGCLPDTTEVVEVTSTTGKVWMDRNLGAFQKADSSTDTRAYGDLYQWGRSADGHQCRESDTISVLASTAASSPDSVWYGKFILAESTFDWLSTPDSTLWQGVDGINNPCPSGFRIPTKSEWEAELAGEPWGAIPGAAGAMASILKLPVSGARAKTGSKFWEGTNGLYLSSTFTGISEVSALRFYDTYAFMIISSRVRGHAVRCIKN